ncbi:SDR family NAD(P)-dependent oxidoreductase [Nocardia tengchongensis]|uniref:SDR family NAD(P)-dependent oxidoreductase n=1 Tax=Nocardia tengchongensis TaxID=2055889 RepID=UPI0036ADF933
MSTVMTGWTQEEIPDQSGRSYIVTGASSGIGEATARALVGRGARVILACRDIEKARPIADALGGRAEIRRLDLADLASVREFTAACETVDTVIANAGISTIPKKLSPNGIELQFATNHLGHFALVHDLLDRIRDRIVVVSSMSHHFVGMLHMGRIDLTDLDYSRRSYSPFGAYCQSKLANLLFVRELRQRLAAEGSTVRAIAVHPGISRTSAGLHTETKSGELSWNLITRAVGQDADMGAWPSLYAATHPDVPSGSYVGPGGLLGVKGTPAIARTSAMARNDRLARELWLRSEQLIAAPHRIR